MAQPRDEAALEALTAEILEAVHEHTECRFVVLWSRFEPRTGASIVRVHGSPEPCAAALEEANHLGRPRRVFFATLATLGEPLETEPEDPPRPNRPPPQVDRPPRHFDLIHEVFD
jgi:hypothetical protein